MHADRHTSRGVYTMFWTLTKNLIYLQVHPVSRVEAIIEESGTERLKIYPFLFEQI